MAKLGVVDKFRARTMAACTAESLLLDFGFSTFSSVSGGNPAQRLGPSGTVAGADVCMHARMLVVMYPCMPARMRVVCMCVFMHACMHASIHLSIISIYLAS